MGNVMRHRAALAASALVVATGLVLVAGTRDLPGDAPGDATGAAPTASPAATVDSSAAASVGATGAAAASASSSPSSRGTRQGRSPAATPTTGPSVGGDPSAAATSAPGTAQPEVPASTNPGSTLLPGLQSAPATLLPSPLPRDGSRLGGLVSGYPGRLAPVLPGSEITSSSVTSDGGVLTVTLVASTSRPVPGLLAFYAHRLARLGFVAREVQAVPGSRAVAHRRGPSSVVVTVEPGSPTTYTLVGRWAAATA